MAKRRPSEPIALGVLVPAVFGQHTGVMVSIVSAIWDRVLPPRVVKNASPTRLRNRVLNVETTTSAWAQEVTLMAPTILDKLRGAMPSLEIDSLRVRAGPFPKRPVVDKHRPPKVRPLAEDELPSDLASALERVEDAPLRDALTRAARQSLAHEPKRPRRA